MSRITGLKPLLLTVACIGTASGTALAQQDSIKRIYVSDKPSCAAICEAQFSCESWSFERADWADLRSVCLIQETESRPTFSFAPNARNALSGDFLRTTSATTLPPLSRVESSPIRAPLQLDIPEELVPAVEVASEFETVTETGVVRLETPTITAPAPRETQVEIENPLVPVVEVQTPAELDGPVEAVATQEPAPAPIVEIAPAAAAPVVAEVEPAPDARQLRGIEQPNVRRTWEDGGIPRYSVQRDAERELREEAAERPTDGS